MRLPSIKIAVFMFALALLLGVALAKCQGPQSPRVVSGIPPYGWAIIPNPTPGCRAWDLYCSGGVAYPAHKLEGRRAWDSRAELWAQNATSPTSVTSDPNVPSPKPPAVEAGDAAAQAKAEAKEISLPDADADKFLLAAERKAHADTRVQAAWSAWVSANPEILKLYQEQQERARALDAVAEELLRKAGLDAARYQLDADGAGKPPHPKYVLRKDAAAKP